MKDLAGRTAIVVPVKNEAASIERLLSSFERLTVKPREIIIVDGGSKDSTKDFVKDYLKNRSLPYRLRLIELDEALPGRGRNVGVESSSCEIAACTDAGCVVDRNWLKAILSSFEKDKGADVVIGGCMPDTRSFFEECTFFITVKPLMEKYLTYRGAVSIAFKKALWSRVKGYPDYIYPAEDKAFLNKLKRCKARISVSKNAVVYWQPRGSVSTFSRQYFDYARAEGRFRLTALKHALRILLYTLGIILLMCGTKNRFCAMWLAIAVICYLFPRTKQGVKGLKKLKAALYIPLLLFLKDISQIFGYILGSMEYLLNARYRAIAREKYRCQSLQ